jgi:regulator of sigma E protease
MNILPIPGLDGGHALFTFAEIVTGRKPSDKFLEYAQMVGMVLLMGLMAYALGLDVWRIFK